MKNLIGMIAFTILASCLTQEAHALPDFKKAFANKYAAKHESKDFQAAVKKASCNACHVKGAKKNVQNEYGKLLNKLIEGDADKIIKDAKKEGKEAGDKAKADILAALEKAFDKAAKEKSEKGKGPTYGELIKAGKLPVDVAKAQADYKAEQAKRKESEG